MTLEQITCPYCNITNWSESKDYPLGSEEFGNKEYQIRKWTCSHCSKLIFNFQILRRLSGEPTDLIVNEYDIISNKQIFPED